METQAQQSGALPVFFYLHFKKISVMQQIVK
jgi:hypothetical protein